MTGRVIDLNKTIKILSNCVFILLIFSMWSCENSLFNTQLKTPVHLELTSVRASSPQELKLYFSEILAEKNILDNLIQICEPVLGCLWNFAVNLTKST